MLSELVLKNRSYRSFNNARKVTREELVALVSLARVTPSAANRQPLKYRLVTADEMGKLLPCTKWAAALPQMHFPPEGHEPTAAIAVCHDTAIFENPQSSAVDRGIVGQTMLLGAAELGLGGIMIENFRADAVREALALPENLVPALVIAFGEPDEKIVLEDAADSTKYYRDAENVHHVPKRKLEDLIV